MRKTVKIVVNALVFGLIAGFGYYMVRSMTIEKKRSQSDAVDQDNTFISLYEKVADFETASDLLCFDLLGDSIYVALSDRVSVYHLSGKHIDDFKIEAGVRKMEVAATTIYLLYPTRIDLYNMGGEKIGGWEACSDQSDYCSFAITKEFIFVTDAHHKEVVQYDKEGGLLRFIKSPQGFIIPSWAFDIIAINDTIYCVNSGRHKIESYTLDGAFIASFGLSGSEAGAFAGCCNPIYLTKSAHGHIVTSEKGNPRISCYGRDGKFRTILFDAAMLGGGTDARKVRVWGEKIYIANKRSISLYSRREVANSTPCAGCQGGCTLRKAFK